MPKNGDIKFNSTCDQCGKPLYKYYYEMQQTWDVEHNSIYDCIRFLNHRIIELEIWREVGKDGPT